MRNQSIRIGSLIADQVSFGDHTPVGEVRPIEADAPTDEWDWDDDRDGTDSIEFGKADDSHNHDD